MAKLVKKEVNGKQKRKEIVVVVRFLPFSQFSVNALSKSSSDERGVSANDSLLFNFDIFGFAFCKSFDSADYIVIKHENSFGLFSVKKNQFVSNRVDIQDVPVIRQNHTLMEKS